MARPTAQAPGETRPGDPASFSSPSRRYPLFSRLTTILFLLGFGSLACNLGAALDEAVPASPTPERQATAEVSPSPTLPPTTATSSSMPTATPIIVAAVPGYVILTDINEDDPYFAAVDKLRLYREAEIVRFEDDVAEAKDALRALAPNFMAVVIRPERMEEKFAFEVFQLAKDLRGGFDTDVAYGFITGATAEDTVAYIEKVITYEMEQPQLNPIARTLWRTGQGAVSDGAAGIANEVTQESVDLMDQLGFQAERIDLDPLSKDEIMAQVEDASLLFLYLHGMPNYVECGLTCQDIIGPEDVAKMTEVRLVLSSSCYTGSIHTWYPQQIPAPETYEARAEQIDPAESIALAFLRHNALAYVGHMCMWGSNNWPLVLLQALVDDPDRSLGEMMVVWYDTAKGPNIIEESAATDLVGMDNNRFYVAAMVLYGDPAIHLNYPELSD
jgi:hypothetical protein